ncbi:MAG TPA: hypothetical protein VIK84_04795 [Haloplasmataceae bacterium]
MSKEKAVNTKTNKRLYKRLCDLPSGLKNACCPKCNSKNLTGAIITEFADEFDPNILCRDCGYWRD